MIFQIYTQASIKRITQTVIEIFNKMENGKFKIQIKADLL